MMNISAVTSSSLIGLYRSDLKSLITILGLAAQIIITWAFIKPLGLRALAIGQVVQYAFMALVSWFVITKVSTGRLLWRPPYRWNPTAARELFGYGMRAQGLNLAGFLFEPTTKFAISAICGVHALGLYELASRGLMQVRQVIVTPSGNLTPLFAKASTVGNRRVARTYGRAITALVPLSIVSMLGLIVISPLLSIIWVGHLEADFIAMTAILAALWSMNLIALPSYYLGLGANHLRWSIWGALATALSSPILVILLAPVIGDYGAALGAGLAIAIGAIITMRTPQGFGTRPLPRLRYFSKMARLLALALRRRIRFGASRIALQSR
jgi:O-antigen/teichoic acid export membrane protein